MRPKHHFTSKQQKPVRNKHQVLHVGELYMFILSPSLSCKITYDIFIQRCFCTQNTSRTFYAVTQNIASDADIMLQHKILMFHLPLPPPPPHTHIAYTHAHTHTYTFTTTQVHTHHIHSLMCENLMTLAHNK